MGYFADAQYDVRTPIVGFADTSPEGGSEISFTVFASGAKQSPGRVNCRTAEFPCHRERRRGDPPEKVCGIYSVLYSKGLPRSLCSLAMTSKKEYVILSASEISHDHSDKAYTLRKFTLPGVDSPDETGEVARVSATKRGRAVEPAALRSQRQKSKR